MGHVFDISIHAPRVGSDTGAKLPLDASAGISIHAPRVGSDDLRIYLRRWVSRFQSTLPVWGATFTLYDVAAALYISIHAPRVGSDTNMAMEFENAMAFQSTLPVWGATFSMLYTEAV